jgi:hypothetical protein
MIIFVNAGFGDVIHREMAEDIKSMGFDGVRTDALYAGPHGAPPTLVPSRVLDETWHHASVTGLSIQWLISRPLETGPIGIDDAQTRIDAMGWTRSQTHSFDVGMEFNHSKARYGAQHAVDLINACKDAAGSIPVSACLTNNMGRDALAYARQCFDLGMRCKALGLHPYKTTVKPWEPARGSGWSSREEEWSAWQALAKEYDCELWAPEWGYHCGVSNVPAPGWAGKLGKKIKLSYSEDQQREFVEYELFDQIARGVEMSGVFQYNDAADADTNPNHEAHYGMRRADGSHKPVVGAIQYVQRRQRGES